MSAYRGDLPNFLSMISRLSPVSAHNLGLSLGEDPRINAKALKCIVAADEGIRQMEGSKGDSMYIATWFLKCMILLRTSPLDLHTGWRQAIV